MNYYQAYQLRSLKAKPTDWIIIPKGYGLVRLVCLKPQNDN